MVTYGSIDEELSEEEERREKEELERQRQQERREQSLRHQAYEKGKDYVKEKAKEEAVKYAKKAGKKILKSGVKKLAEEEVATAIAPLLVPILLWTTAIIGIIFFVGFLIFMSILPIAAACHSDSLTGTLAGAASYVSSWITGTDICDAVSPLNGVVKWFDQAGIPVPGG